MRRGSTQTPETKARIREGMRRAHARKRALREGRGPDTVTVPFEPEETDELRCKCGCSEVIQRGTKFLNQPHYTRYKAKLAREQQTGQVAKQVQAWRDRQLAMPARVSCAKCGWSDDVPGTDCARACRVHRRECPAGACLVA